MGMFWDLAQDGRIESIQAGSAAAEQRARDTEARCARLEERVRQLSLLSQAMWEILREKLGVTEEELVAWANSFERREPPIEEELYGPPPPPPPPPLVICRNCNTRFEAFEPICPGCRCRVA